MSDKFWNEDTVNDEVLGLVDTRCSADEIAHGNFKDLMEQSKVMFDGDLSQAEAFVKQNRKQSDVDAVLQPFIASKIEETKLIINK